MKYIVVLGDGMADEPIAELGGKTPMEAALTPVMDELASKGILGTVQNVPAGMAPGSDVANLSVLGYDPAENYSGRSPLEALSVGVAMEENDVIFRSNIVTLTEEEPYGEKTILDHSSGEIPTADADVLMDAIREHFNNETFQFYTGTSYRHILVWKNGRVSGLEPPHDHLGSVIGPYLPQEPVLREMMEKSFPILNDHPLNRARAAAGKNKANSLWFWGAGTKPKVQNFQEKTGLKGAMISAVDLLKGIAVGAGMQVCQVEGATGSIDTNFEGKAQAAIDALLRDGCDFAYIHVEAPDEMGHQGKAAEKVKSIEYLDSRLIALVKKAMEDAGEDFRMLILPDHPTPIRIRTHTGDPVPYLLYDSTRQLKKRERFTEETARAADNFEPNGYRLLEKLIAAE
ncbi:MAG: cofactor-independent phosphoglycerate mutase [Firmicutes bacterium]|nr:cofactor-independent phosphoglycerate mutase [Bacillota bacterium]MDY6161273.1 cofactor-independent phosphoglycerate mutase [Candidatus Faecousia sp.]